MGCCRRSDGSPRPAMTWFVYVVVDRSGAEVGRFGNIHEARVLARDLVGARVVPRPDSTSP